MRLQWNSEYSVSIDEIDNQHKELFARINDLDSAIKKGKSIGELTKVIDFLEQYIIYHFGTEEKTMVDHGYPGFQLHKKKHLWFNNEFAAMKGKLENEGPTPDLIMLVNHLLISWFSNHIRTIDRLLGSFIRGTRTDQGRAEAADGTKQTLHE